MNIRETFKKGTTATNNDAANEHFFFLKKHKTLVESHAFSLTFFSPLALKVVLTFSSSIPVDINMMNSP
jgi:hypothetical protein